ncbi:MAG TPA: prephenate dehydratase domain-containing protein [Candidatus Saccharimonadales bacterium]|nr:prephenate dehydratase domain-containing protein [Candidatus Saccharimonadales bacterium]
MIVAIQGQAGSFHEVAAHRMHGDQIRVLPCPTFADVFSAVNTGRAKFGVVAVDNTIHGEITESTSLLRAYKPHIQNELWLPIELCLIGHPGTKLEDLTKVYSQGVALAQCQTFFEEYLPAIEQFEHHDTAASVELVALQGDPAQAAIASSQAAKHHGMRVIACGVQDTQDDHTKFVTFSFV